MKLIAENGEVLAEWTPNPGKRNLYCSGGFGLMLTKKAMEICLRADDKETIDLFKASDHANDQVEDDAVPEREEKKIDFRIFGIEV